MAVRRLHTQQPESFAFTPENQAWAEDQITHYPEGRQASAVIAILWRAQEQHNGWLPEPAIRLVADMLEMPYIRVFEIATFYTMFQLQPVGTKAHFQVCGTTPCMLRGSEDLIALCKKKIAPNPHQLSADGAFSWEEVECLGMCVNAPVVQMHVKSYEDLTPESFETIIDAYSRGDEPAIGPQVERVYSAPEGGATTLTSLDFGDAPIPPASQVANPTAGSVSPSGGVDGESVEGNEPDDANGSVAGTAEAVVAADASRSDETQNAAEASMAPAAAAATTPDPDDEEAVAEKLATLGADASAEDKANAVGSRPDGLEAARGGTADDLKRIKGIGKVNEGKLNELGIWHFDQIAVWNRSEVRWVGTYLSFAGRIDREDWIGQAKVLAAGGETEFAKRVDAGEVSTSQGGPSKKPDDA